MSHGATTRIITVRPCYVARPVPSRYAAEEFDESDLSLVFVNARIRLKSLKSSFRLQIRDLADPVSRGHGARASKCCPVTRLHRPFTVKPVGAQAGTAVALPRAFRDTSSVRPVAASALSPVFRVVH